MLSPYPSKFRYFIELSYHGLPYHGWQIQPNGVTVQERVNLSLTTVLGEAVNVVGCGRTDTGVHASHFVCHADLAEQLEDPDHLCYQLDRFLEKSISIHRIVPVDPGLHARFSAVSRTYIYLINRENTPFLREISWHHNRALDVGAMRHAALKMIGQHDYSSFCRLHSDVKHHVCHVSQAEFIESGDLLVFRVKADRFLRNMVRAMVGTLVLVGNGKLAPDAIETILRAGTRSAAGPSVPAEGLFLVHVAYPDGTFDTNPKYPFPIQLG